jgi:DNA (cytosine-5)-methyltransferase 1
MKVKQIGNLVGESNWSNPHRGRVYSTDGIAPALNTCQGGQREVKVLEIEKILIKQAVKGGVIECANGGVADLSFPGATTRRGRVVDGGKTSPALTAGEPRVHRIEVNPTLRIRKLTPRECWRLQDYSDADFEKAQAVNSATQLYKQAGNGITRNVLVAIFGQLFADEEKRNKYKDI